MAQVWIPALLRDLADGQQTLRISGETVAQLIENLEARFPGIKLRLCEDGRLRPGFSVSVDGEVSPLGLRQRLQENSEVHFLPAISGG